MTESPRRIDVRFILSTFLELAGVVAITWGCALIAPFLGFIVGGVVLILFGLAVDPPVRRPKTVIEEE